MNRSETMHHLRRDLIERARAELNRSGAETDDSGVRRTIEELLFNDERSLIFNAAELSEAASSVFYTIRCELGVLTPLLDEPEITEIMVNGPSEIYIERAGNLERSKLSFETTEELEEVIRRIAARVHREINELNPILDARLQNGDRVNAVYKNIALGGPSLSIRKFPETALTMEDLIWSGSITEEAALYLKKLVAAGYNCFISGGTSSGKTTFLNILSSYIPVRERVVVIEDSAELQLGGVENVVRLECRNANVQGKGEVNMETLIKNSLRMRPDRIIVGEIRGGECADMIQAMNTGHAGMSTGHANSIEGMLRRMEAMYLQKTPLPLNAIREQIAQGIDVIIHLGRIHGMGRRVLEISEIAGLSDDKFIINKLFQYKIDEGLVATGHKLSKQEKLHFAGVTL